MSSACILNISSKRATVRKHSEVEVLALSTHPRLLAEAEAKTEEVQEETPVAVSEPEVPVEPSPEPTSEEVAPASEATPETVVEERKVYLDPERYHQEILRLEAEDEKFRNAIRTRLGRQAAKEYKPKIADLEARLAEREAELAKVRQSTLTEDEIKERLLTDPEFRRQYDSKPADPVQIRERATLELQRDEILENAERFLTKEEIAPYVQAAAQGVFDWEFDANRRPIRRLTPVESMTRFQSGINAAIQQKFSRPPAQASAPQQAAPPPPPPPQATQPEVPAAVEAPKANTALAQASPDLSTGNSTRVASQMTMAQVRSMNPPDLVRLFPEGIAKAVESGKISVE